MSSQSGPGGDAQLPSLRRYIYTFVLLFGLLHIVAIFVPMLAGRIAFADIDGNYLRSYIPSPNIIALCAIIVGAMFAVDSAVAGFSLLATALGLLIIAGIGIAASIWFLSGPVMITLTGDVRLDFAIIAAGLTLVIGVPLYLLARARPGLFGR